MIKEELKELEKLKDFKVYVFEGDVYVKAEDFRKKAIECREFREENKKLKEENKKFNKLKIRVYKNLHGDMWKEYQKFCDKNHI